MCRKAVLVWLGCCCPVIPSKPKVDLTTATGWRPCIAMSSSDPSSKVVSSKQIAQHAEVLSHLHLQRVAHILEDI